jgi:hypothetical protein
MGTSSTKLRLFLHKVFFIINAGFPPLPEMLYASHRKLSVEVSDISINAIFQIIIVHTVASSECILQVAKILEVRGY